ncbi:hypothetical protein QQF64_012571 [Cirrhinus molitorella]|uniref:Prolactin receptor n=1 Tax=Cirrhinus molitorella TaxID=172907 RepID=A0ABR3LYB5_9TELE
MPQGLGRGSTCSGNQILGHPHEPIARKALSLTFTLRECRLRGRTNAYMEKVYVALQHVEPMSKKVSGALQYCFGGPPDVSADPASYQDPELSKTGPDPAMGLAVLTQPGPIKPVRTDSQPSFSCISIQTKTNGTNCKTKEPNTENQGTLHSYQSSEGLSEEDDAQDRSPVLDTKWPHIPRPSIIRPQKEHPIQDSLPVRTDYIVPEDGPLSAALALHQPPHSYQSAPLAKVLGECTVSVCDYFKTE